MSAATSRVRPAIRWFAVIAFALLLPIAAHSLWDYIEVRRLARELENIRAAGEPVTEREALGMDEPAPADARGAADYYLAGAMLALGTRSYDVTNPVREWLAAPSPSRAQLELLVKPLQALVAATHDAAELADRATPLAFTRLTAGTEYSYRSASLAALSGAIAARTLNESIAGNGDAAVDSLITGLRLRRALSTPLWRPDADSTDAVLSLTHPSAEALRRLDAVLADQDRPDFAHQSFLRQRALYVERIWRQTYGPDPGAPRQFTLPARTPLQYVWRPWYSHHMVNMLRTWAELVEISKLPWPKKIHAGEQLRRTPTTEDYLQGERIGNVFVFRGLPFEMLARSIDAAPLVMDRCARIAVAVERFRLDHKQIPDALADLVPGYLAAIPEDPFTGQPLLFRRTSDAYTIYSVGSNVNDDGGDLRSETKGDAGPARSPRRNRGADVGMRVLMMVGS